jgi:PKHD-type hydroxylase
MIRQALNNPYWYSKNRLSDDICDEIIRLGKELELTEAGIFGANADKVDNKKLRVTNAGWFPKGHTVEMLIHNHVALANLEANWNFRVTGKERVQFGEYKTKAFYDWHTDSVWNYKVPFRKLSVTVNLSDPKDYAGGNFEMKNVEGHQLKMPMGQFRQRGTVIVFPSFLKHRVTEVTRGTRYSLVQWLNGPDFI